MRQESRRPLRLVQQPLGEVRREDRPSLAWALFGAAMYVVALALVVVHLLGGGA